MYFLVLAIVRFIWWCADSISGNNTLRTRAVLKGGASDPFFSVKNSSEPNFDAYLKRMQIMIKRHWYPPKDTHKSQTVVEFTINASGQLSNLRVATSSGDPAKDAAALEAVKQTVPYEMLPKGSPQEVAISFSFDFDPKYALSDSRNKPQIVRFMGSKVEVSNPSASQKSK